MGRTIPILLGALLLLPNAAPAQQMMEAPLGGGPRPPFAARSVGAARLQERALELRRLIEDREQRIALMRIDLAAMEEAAGLGPSPARPAGAPPSRPSGAGINAPREQTPAAMPPQTGARAGQGLDEKRRQIALLEREVQGLKTELTTVEVELDRRTRR